MQTEPRIISMHIAKQQTFLILNLTAVIYQRVSTEEYKKESLSNILVMDPSLKVGHTGCYLDEKSKPLCSARKTPTQWMRCFPESTYRHFEMSSSDETQAYFTAIKKGISLRKFNKSVFVGHMS